MSGVRNKPGWGLPNLTCLIKAKSVCSYRRYVIFSISIQGGSRYRKLGLKNL
jgi:hypothetical protein